MIIGVENIKQLFEDENNIHIFLIRHPVHILKSWSKVLGINQTNLRESAFLQMMEVLSWINNSDPVIIESDCLVKDPELVLSAVCRKIGIEFNAKMLSWPSGPKDFDGIWAPWYEFLLI